MTHTKAMKTMTSVSTISIFFAGMFVLAGCNTDPETIEDGIIGDTGAPLSNNVYEMSSDPCAAVNPAHLEAVSVDTYEFPEDGRIIEPRKEQYDGSGSINYDYMKCVLRSKRNIATLPGAENWQYDGLVITLHFRIYSRFDDDDERNARYAFNNWDDTRHYTSGRRGPDVDKWNEWPVDGRPWTHAAFRIIDRSDFDAEEILIAVLDGNMVIEGHIGWNSRGANYYERISTDQGKEILDKTLADTILGMRSGT